MERKEREPPEAGVVFCGYLSGSREKGRERRQAIAGTVGQRQQKDGES